MIASLFALVLAAQALTDTRPAAVWPDEWHPLGNGEVGCMVDGGVASLTLRYCAGAPWTQPCGTCVIRMDALKGVPVTDYRRELDLVDGVYTDRFTANGAWYERSVFVAPHPDGIRIRIRSARQANVRWTLADASGGKPQNVRMDVLNRGLVSTVGHSLVLHFRASGDDPFGDTFDGWNAALAAHRDVHARWWGRCTLELPDAPGDAFAFGYGRYRMIASSRPGTRGLGVDCADADAVNLPECFEAQAATWPTTTRTALLQYEHYLFNGVRPYLRNVVWPVLREAGEKAIGSRDDLTRELFRDVLRAQKVADGDQAFGDRIREAYRQLPKGASRPFRLDSTDIGRMAERLLQSHEREGGKVVLRLLPDLPPNWRTGKAVGLKARGDYAVDMEWKDGKIVSHQVYGGNPNGYVIR